MNPGWLGLDVGSKTIGVAMTDEAASRRIRSACSSGRGTDTDVRRSRHSSTDTGSAIS